MGRVSFLGNLLYLSAFSFYFIITFLGYNSQSLVLGLFIFSVVGIGNSPSLFEPNRSPVVPRGCSGDPLGYQFGRIQRCEACGAPIVFLDLMDTG